MKVGMFEGDLPSLSLGRLAELGPLGPAPAHSRYSFHDGLNFRYRGGIRRAPEAGDFGLGKASRAGVGLEREGPF